MGSMPVPSQTFPQLWNQPRCDWKRDRPSWRPNPSEESEKRERKSWLMSKAEPSRCQGVPPLLPFPGQQPGIAAVSRELWMNYRSNQAGSRFQCRGMRLNHVKRVL